MIVIDPGHGGADPGCDGHGLIEKNLTLHLALLLRDIAQVSGLPVRLIRDCDTTLGLGSRARRASAFDAEQVLCLHFDTNPDPSVGRLTCYCDEDDQQSRALAADVIAVAPPVLTQGSRTIFVEPVGWKRRAFNVVQAYQAPALLVECAFVSNAHHANFLRKRFGLAAVSTSLLCALLSAEEVWRGTPSTKVS